MIYAVHFSPTLTTKKIVLHLAESIARSTGEAYEEIDYLPPQVRKNGLTFCKEDLVIFGMPVYAGRVPNLIAKDMAHIAGNGAKCVPVVLFGNRAFDDALLELRDILEKSGMQAVAAGAFVGEHAFSDTLGSGRPNEEDLALAEKLANLALQRLESGETPGKISGVPEPYSGYYQPRLANGTPIDIRKVKPETDSHCDNCGLCAKLCPMGAISPEHPAEIVGICIKCGACIKRCPRHAKYISDAGYLAHKRDLEENQSSPKKSVIF